MLDIGWQEIIILMLIALIVVGPKDLPRIVKTAGQWMGKARGYARDFQRTIEEAADATEIDAVKKEIDEANRELATARRDVAEGADAMQRDVNEGTESVNKMFSEDAMASAKAATAKPNGGEPPAGEAAASDGGQAETAAASAADSEPAAAQAAPATPAAEPQGDGSDGSPARGASA
jgi:sec-independent protein translocase protein TatB